MAAKLAWTLCALSAVAIVIDTAVVATYQPLLSEESIAVHGFPFIPGAVLGSAAMGALVVAHDGRHPIGWLLSLIGLSTALALLSESVSIWIVDEGGPGPRSVGSVAGWVSMVLGGPAALAGVALLLLVAPSGRFLSRRWRWFAAVPALGAACCVTAMLFVSPTGVDLRDPGPDVAAAQSLWSAGVLLLGLGLLGSLVSMIIRLRRAEGVQRQQLRLIATSAALVAVGFTTLLLVQALNGGRQTWASSMPLFVSYFCLPILFAIAVLRFRLYDIEVILNRTLVVALGTLFAGLGYTALVVTVGQVVDTRAGGFWVSLLATTLVALAFQPARRWVVGFANRLAFGPRAKPYEALAAFSRRLSETPAAETLLLAVAEAAGRSVVATSATAVLDVPGEAPVSVTWPPRTEPGDASYVVEVTEDRTTLGQLLVRLPHGRPMTDGDRRLLGDLAEQCAVAFRNLALERRLAAQVADLDEATRKLADSRRRLVEADDTAHRRLEAELRREVLPRLEPMPARIRSLSATPLDEIGQAEVEHLVQETNAALEALRDLTRGVFPTVLERSGLVAALRSGPGAAPAPALRHVGAGAEQRFPAHVELAAYDACRAAAATRSSPLDITMDLEHGEPDELVLGILGLDLTLLDVPACSDRVEAAGGTVRVAADRLEVRLPVETQQAPVTARS
jgi:hypothetical protein